VAMIISVLGGEELVKPRIKFSQTTFEMCRRALDYLDEWTMIRVPHTRAQTHTPRQ